MSHTAQAERSKPAGIQLVTGSKPEEALMLPKGSLCHDELGGESPVAFTEEGVIECAELIISQEDIPDIFTTQAQVIEYAGNYLGWGSGQGYTARQT
jgi:hypothetical protein